MNVNGTIVIQLLIYLALILILKKLYFDPVLRLLRRREEMTSGKKQGAEALRGKVARMKEEYETQLNEVKQRLESERLSKLNLIKETSAAQIKSAKETSEKKLNEHRTELEQETRKLRQKLADWSSDVSKEIVNSILNSKVIQL